ncbi:MAG: hypothetical protein QOG94_1222 [Solirubrobacteraceae bacterium]|jgi:hypothetical protein|nr:hypothetical protein [Solirubrobacteraceae bacterium]
MRRTAATCTLTRSPQQWSSLTTDVVISRACHPVLLQRAWIALP